MKPVQAALFFIIGTLMMMVWYHNELLLLGFMLISTIACLALDKWRNTKRFLTAMLVGGVCENIAVVLGAWSYSNAAYLPVPIWLPVGWGMSVILLEEAFSHDTANESTTRFNSSTRRLSKSTIESTIEFSKSAVAMAFGGTIITALDSSNEIAVLIGFVVITFILFKIKFYHKFEIIAGVAAAVFGTAMETACILVGNWNYTTAIFGTPIWLPLCWFNAFLIMRRIIRMGE